MSVVDVCRRILNGNIWKTCHSCNTPLNPAKTLLGCSECKIAAYCSQPCFDNHSAAHADTCQMIGNKDKRKRIVPEGRDERNVRAREEPFPVGLADAVFRVLVNNDVWLHELARGADIETVARWNQVSRNFRRYLYNNQRFWYHFIMTHRPDLLNEQFNVERPRNYRAIAFRFFGGPFSAESYRNYQEQLLFSTFNMLANNEAALRQYVRDNTVEHILSNMVTSKSFRYFFYNSPKFWNMLADVMDPTYKARDVGDDMRKFVMDTIVVDYDPVIFRFYFEDAALNNAKLPAEYRVANDKNYIIVTIPYYVFIRDTSDVVLDTLEAAIELELDGTGYINKIPFPFKRDFLNFVLWVTVNDEPLFTDTFETTFRQILNIHSGDMVDIDILLDPDADELIRKYVITWDPTDICPIFLKYPNRKWENNGTYTIYVKSVEYLQDIKQFVPDFWVSAQNEEPLNAQDFQITNDGNISSFDLSQHDLIDNLPFHYGQNTKIHITISRVP